MVLGTGVFAANFSACKFNSRACSIFLILYPDDVCILSYSLFDGVCVCASLYLPFYFIMGSTSINLVKFKIQLVISCM